MENSTSVFFPYKKIQALLSYQQPGRAPYQCRLEIYHEAYEAVVVFSTRKVENAVIAPIEELATEVLRHYRLRVEYTEWLAEKGKEHFSLELNWVEQRCYAARWNPITPEKARQIKDEVFDHYERRLGFGNARVIGRSF